MDLQRLKNADIKPLTDAGGVPIAPVPWSRGFTLTDATLTPQVSPISSDTTEITLVWPADARQLNVYAPTQALELRTIPGGATGGTAPVPSATWFAIPGKPGGTTILGRPNGATTVSFSFELMI